MSEEFKDYIFAGLFALVLNIILIIAIKPVLLCVDNTFYALFAFLIAIIILICLLPYRIK